MKTFLPAILLFFCTSITAQILPEYSGSWYNRDQDGHGLNIEVIDEERTIAFWYTYSYYGSPIWFLFDGVNVDNRIEATVYFFDNMFWGQFDPRSLNRQVVGTATIEFSDCDHARLIYSLGYYGDGEIPLERLTYVSGMKCNQVGKLAGIWMATVNTYGQDFWVKTTVHEDGTFIIYDAMACIWKGQISVDNEATGLLATTLGTDTCGWKVPEFEMIGFYIEPYTICGSGGQCQTYDAAMGFEGYTVVYPGDDDPVSRTVNLRFLWPID